MADLQALLAERERRRAAKAGAEHSRMAAKTGAEQQAAYDAEQPSALENVAGFGATLLDSITPTNAGAEGASTAGVISPETNALFRAVKSPTMLTQPTAPAPQAAQRKLGAPVANALSGAGEVLGRGVSMLAPSNPLSGFARVADAARLTGVVDAAQEAAPGASGLGLLAAPIVEGIAGGRAARAGGLTPAAGGGLRFRPAIGNAAGVVENVAGKVLEGGKSLPQPVRAGLAFGTGGASEAVLGAADIAKNVAGKLRFKAPQHPVSGAPAPRARPDVSGYQAKPLAPYEGAPNPMGAYADDVTQANVSPSAATKVRGADELAGEAEGFDPRGEGWNNWANKTPATPKPGITPPETSTSTPKPPPPASTRVDRTPGPVTGEQAAKVKKSLESGKTPEQISDATGMPLEDVAEVAQSTRTSGGTGGPANAAPPQPPPSASAPETSVMPARQQNQLVGQTDPRFAPDSTGVQSAVAGVEAGAKANAAALGAQPAPQAPQLRFNELPVANIPKATESGLYKSGPSKVDAMTTAEKRTHAKQLLAQGMTAADVAKALKMTPRQIKLLTAGK
jgi:hypothetical protein